MAKLNSRNRFRELGALSSDELKAEIEKLKKESFDLRFKGAAEAVANNARFRQIRKDVARMLTILGTRTPEKATS
ncbi:MAG: 50S ribosomal protein L29 [Planctomycetes bacterium]|nr:50S ribosomal protein L29 [Planctomycetota bacterium]